ncbi:MAG: MmgE/PrpD family protein [Pseudomonadota bacterium]
MRDDPSASGGTQTLDNLCDFVLATRAEDIPQPTLERAALLLLDTLGICAAAAPMEAGQIARETAHRFFAASSATDTAPMLFDGRVASLSGAIFAAASQIDNLDGHDGYNPTKGHIGVVAIPALVTLAHHRPDLSGREALTALVLGYEVAGRAGIALHASVSDYHTSGAWNALGVAAMAARLRGLNNDQLREALGIAEYHGPRSQMMREIANPTMLHDGSGWGGLAGITAALMAEQGFTGAPAITVEAPDAAPHWADIGQFWQVDHQYIKPYPVCRWAHAAIDAAREMIDMHGVRAEDIVRVRIGSFDNAVALYPGMPQTTSQAQYSLTFAVAAQIVHGHIGLAQISGAGLVDPAVARLVEATDMVAEPRHEARFPEGRWADVSFTLRDGRVIKSGDVHARGGPERPFSSDDIRRKYKEFAGDSLGRTRASALAEAILALTQEGSTFADVAAHLYDPL